jgi:hypothetical protein
MDEKTMQEQLDELTEWLELHEIDDLEYAEKFRELQQLEMKIYYDQE